MAEYQLTVSDGTKFAFSDDRELDEIIEQVIEDGYLKVTGERSLVGQTEAIEGDFVAFESHIVSISA